MSEHAEQDCEIDWRGGNVTLHVEGSSYSFPLDDLETWIDFYQRQLDLFPKARRLYEAKIQMLKQTVDLRNAI